MKQTSEAAFETAIEAVLLNDGYGNPASGAFDTEQAKFPNEVLTFVSSCLRVSRSFFASSHLRVQHLIAEPHP